MALADPRKLTGMAAPMAVWALHLLLVYGLQGLACARGLLRARMAGAEAVTWWLLAATMAALAAIAWLGLRALRAWRRLPPDPPSRQRFAALLGALLALLAALAVLFTTVPVLLLPACD